MQMMRRAVMCMVLGAGTACAGEFAGYPLVEDAARVQPGVAATQGLVTNLQSRLQAALAGGDPVPAMEVCASLAQPLTRQTLAAHHAVTDIRRVTDKTRNPINAADEIDLRILEAARNLRADQLPKPLAIDPGLPGQPLRLYTPLYIQPVCLKCHGPPDTLAPGVKEILDRRYPEDRATGYREGDLRGWIRVDLPATPAP